MPSSNKSEDVRPCANLNNVVQHSSKDHAERLIKLENEVFQLRHEVDKIKWQRAAAETAIERAIAQGASALGERYKILVPGESTSMKERCHRKNTNEASDESIASKDSRLPKKNDDKLVACETAAGNNSKGKKTEARVCGLYTLG